MWDPPSLMSTLSRAQCVETVSSYLLNLVLVLWEDITKNKCLIQNIIVCLLI